MQAATLLLLAVAIGSEVYAQSFYGSIGMSTCPAYAMYGSQTSAGVSAAWTVGATSLVQCQYCVQGSVTGSSTTTVSGTATSYTYTGTAYFCAQSCPSSTATIAYSSGSALLTTTGISLAPNAYYYGVAAYGLPGYSSTTSFSGSFTITSMTCYKAAAWKSSASPVLLLALVAGAFILRKN